MKFCPQCGQRLTGLDREEKRRLALKPEAPRKERNWFERHLNWTMVLGVLAAYAAAFVAGLVIASSDPYVSVDVLYIVGVIVDLAVITPVWWWALRRKNRSLWWLPLGLFVPFGWIVVLCLENKSPGSDASSNAMAHYNNGIELNRNHAGACYNRGDAYDGIGEHGNATTDYSRAIELEPGHGLAYHSGGCAYSEIGEYEKAIADYSKAIELDPSDAQAYYNRGLDYQNKGEVSKAVSDLEKCIEVSTDPDLAQDARQALFQVKNSPGEGESKRQ